MAFVGIAAIYSGYAFGSPHAGMSPAAVGVLVTSIGVAGLVGIVKSSIELRKQAQEYFQLKRLGLASAEDRNSLSTKIRDNNLNTLTIEPVLYLLTPEVLVAYALLGKSATRENYTEIATIITEYKRHIQTDWNNVQQQATIPYIPINSNNIDQQNAHIGNELNRWQIGLQTLHSLQDPCNPHNPCNAKYINLEQRFSEAKAKIWPSQAASPYSQNVPQVIPATICSQPPSP